VKLSFCAVSLFALTLNASQMHLISSLNEDMRQASDIATQTNQNIDYQPFILSVFNTDDLIKLGIKNLGEALTLVPGVDMATNTMNNRTPIFRSSNPTAYGQSALVIDGIVVNGSLFSNYNAYLDIPIELIERIEIVRGTGSFIEGVNGYAGTINVITHAHSNAPSIQNGTLFGFTGSSNALGAGGWNRYRNGDWALSLDAFAHRHTQHSSVAATDALSNTGFADLGVEQSGMGATYTYKNFELQGRINQFKSGSAFGNLNALPNPDANLKHPAWYLQGKYTLVLDDETNIVFKSAIEEDTWSSDSRALPSGTYGGVFFPNGYWASLMLNTRRISGGALLDYNGLENHRISIGIESQWDKVIDMKSVTTDKDTGVGFVDYTYTARAFFDAANAKRQSTNFYFSDTIDLNEKLALAFTLGNIQTSDVQSQTYERAALVYQTTRSDIVKLMAATGVRYPSFQEMYVSPSLYATGNPNLTHEHVSSVEGQYLHKFNNDLTTGVNLFYLHNSQQIVRDATGTFQNSAKSSILGGEVEIRGSLDDDNTLFASYSYTQGKDDSGNDIADTPSHLIKAALTHNFINEFSMGTIWHYVGSKHRSPSDTRDELDSFNTLDISFGFGMERSRGWYIQTIVNNIADTVVKYPSPMGTYPDDYPVSGRNVWFRTGWKF